MRFVEERRVLIHWDGPFKSPHRCNLLRRHWCRLGCDTVFRSVLSMTHTGTRRFCFPAFKRRIFFAAGLFFDISSTFSDSPDGRIAAALGLLVAEKTLQVMVIQRRGEGSVLKPKSKF